MTANKLNEVEITEKLLHNPGWIRDVEDTKWIRKKFRFREFMTGISFVNEVARISEAQNHHPMMSIDYKMVILRLTTWNAGGLTLLDFEASSAYDKAYLELQQLSSE